MVWIVWTEFFPLRYGSFQSLYGLTETFPESEPRDQTEKNSQSPPPPKKEDIINPQEDYFLEYFPILLD